MRLLSLISLLLSLTALAQDRRPDPNQLVIMTFNAEFLWDGEGLEEGDPDFPWKGNPKLARKHMADIAEVILRANPDIVNLVEVENLRALTTFNNEFLAGRGYLPYLIDGQDTFTGQDVCLLTRVDPRGGIQRDDREGHSGGTAKSVSKNYFAKFQLGNLKFALIGIHFLARPDKPERRLPREAQADAMRTLARQLAREGYQIVILGDVNDFDGTEASRDHLDSRPTSAVLQILKSMGPGPQDDLINVASHIPKVKRFTSFYDRDQDREVDRDERNSIDHVLFSPALDKRVISAEIDTRHDPFKVSDHYPIIVKLKTGPE